MKKLLYRLFGDNHALEQVHKVLEHHHGGIYKRIDENRELLEYLQWHAPEVLNSHPWVVGWIRSQDQFLLDLIAAAELSPPRIFGNLDWPRLWPSFEMQKDPKNDEPLFNAFPTSSNAQLNPQYALRVENFLNSVSERVGENIVLYWWTYRVEPHVCIACDIHGTNESLNITMTITGSIVIPEGPDGDFDLKDACDAWCLLSMLADRLGLRCVASIGQGLQFSSREIEK
jgi:hypothetical protein